MAFLGLSFGSKKQSGTQDTTTNQTTNLTGSQTQNTSSSGTTNTSTTQTGTQSQSGRTSGQTTQNQTQSQQGSTSSSGITTSLGQDVIDALTSTVGNVLGGGITESNIANLSNMIAGRTGAGAFNADQFVSDSVEAARNRGEQTLQEQGSAFASGVGGTAETNTMAALLAQRGRSDLESNLASIRANAEATANQIQNQNLATAVEAQSGVAGIGAALVEALKGGQTTTDTTQLTDQIAQLIGRGTSLEGTTQTGTSTSTEQSTTNQLLNQIAQILTQQTEQTQGTENVSQKGKNGGFGVSLGI